MDIRQLEYFIAVCETGSVNAASRRLFISQQALSKNLDNMESELGMPLFLRSQKKLQLTRAGRMLEKEGREILSRYQKMRASMETLRKNYEESLCISFFSGMLGQFPKGFLKDFICAHPNVHFSISSYLDIASVRDQLNYDVDMLFSTNELRENDLFLLYEYHAPLRALISSRNPLADRAAVQISDLRGLPVITLNTDYDTQNRLDRLLSANGVFIQYRFGDAEMDLIEWMVRNRNAVSFYAGPDWQMPEDTIALPIVDLDILWNFYIYGKSRKLSQAAQELLEAVRQVREVELIRGTEKPEESD